jgi:hypothetical protein
MEPVTVATLVGICATLILNIFQSIKSNHFQSNCSMKPHESRKSSA